LYIAQENKNSYLYIIMRAEKITNGNLKSSEHVLLPRVLYSYIIIKQDGTEGRSMTVLFFLASTKREIFMA